MYSNKQLTTSYYIKQKMLRKVHITERNYTKWSWFDGFTLESVECSLNEETSNVKLVHSSLRQMNYIPGILNITGKTYGRLKGKLLYQCIPDDKRIPIFLVPYQDKKQSVHKIFLDQTSRILQLLKLQCPPMLFRNKIRQSLHRS